MRDYHEYPKLYIGSSDSAYLTLTGLKCIATPSPEGLPNVDYMLDAQILTFGEDQDYNAYFVDQDAIIGEHYKLVESFYHWLHIFDDYQLVRKIEGKTILIYRAGSLGCIIQVIND